MHLNKLLTNGAINGYLLPQSFQLFISHDLDIHEFSVGINIHIHIHIPTLLPPLQLFLQFHHVHHLSLSLMIVNYDDKREKDTSQQRLSEKKSRKCEKQTKDTNILNEKRILFNAVPHVTPY